MSTFTIYQDNYTNTTVVSNRFIDEYMRSANDAQLKIYLYLIRMMSAGLSTSVSEIADVFNYTDKDARFKILGKKSASYARFQRK